jgi:DNA-directed RNA polymerase subunit RPC12/RpoP
VSETVFAFQVLSFGGKIELKEREGFMDLEFSCVKCSQKMVVDDSGAGMTVRCPSCSQDLVVPGARVVPKPQAAEVKTNVKQGALIGGWVCLVAAAALLLMPVPTFFLWIPLTFAAFVLSITAMAQRRVLGGILLLLITVIGVPILWAIGTKATVDNFVAAKKSAEERAASNSVERVAAILADDTNALAVASTAAPDGKAKAEMEPNNTKSSIDSGTTPQPVEQVNKIVGSFGKQLGQVFDPSSAIGQGELTDKTPMYQFTPDKPFRSFSKYYVLITPKTHRIYSIWGRGKVESKGAGVNEQAVIMKLLEEKYGKSETKGMFDSLNDAKRIDFGNREIVVKLDGFMDYHIEIRYYDHDLEKLAEKERLEIETKKVDGSGL